MSKGFPGLGDDAVLEDLDEFAWNWGRVSREEAMEALKGQPEGTFLVRMSQTNDDQYSISVVQDGEVRHIRVINVDGGFVINKADKPCRTIADLVEEKKGEKIKSKLSGGEAKETVLLKFALAQK